MSRWLWALLGGVVLVAIAAVFWTASNQTNVTPPVSPGPAPLTLRAGRPGTRALVGCRPCCAERALASALTCAPGRAGGRSPARSRLACSGRAARSNSGPRWRTASRLIACSRAVPHDALRSARRRAGTFAAACSRSARRSARRRPRPDGRRRKSRAYMRPRASRSWSGPGPIPRRIASGFSSGAAAAGPIGSRWTSSPRPRLSSRRKRSFCLPPPARSTVRLKWKGHSR